jgi:hypothetical protein
MCLSAGIQICKKEPTFHDNGGVKVTPVWVQVPYTIPGAGSVTAAEMPDSK